MTAGGLRHDGDEDRFVVIPRATIRDDRLSFRARGVLAFVLDRPDGWDVRATWLATQGKEGEEAVYSALRELRVLGYYRVERRRGPDGRWVNGTAIRKRPSAAWAAEYAAELEARAAKRKVELPTWTPPEDPTPAATDGDDPDTLTGSPVPGNRSTGSRVPGEGEPGTREPGSPKEERERRSEKGRTGVGEPHVSRGGRDEPPQDDVDTSPAPPAPPRTEPARFCRDWPHPPGKTCGECADARRAHQAWADAELMRSRTLDAAERGRQREARLLADGEANTCPLCDTEGTAVVELPGEDPVTVHCLHDDGRNRRALLNRRAARAALPPRRAGATR